MHTLQESRQDFFAKLLKQDFQGSMAVIEATLEAGFPPKAILLNVVSQAMDEIGVMQANREITLSEVYVVAKIGDAAVERLLRFSKEKPETTATIIIGSAPGDYHSLGRKIVSSFLRMGGFKVIDLGLSASPAQLVDRAVEENAAVICVSALLLHTALRIIEVREIINQRELQDQIKLVVGGAVFNFDDQLYKTVGADATARNAPGAVTVIRALLGAKRP
jgi:methylmalonyl-CoA mutase cobalamin-binding domain/chain